MTQSRTHTCGELRLANAGETVTLVGWMENIREVGNNFAFLVLRDFYGTTQVVIENEEMMNIVKPLNKESTISVTGIVRERTSKNPKLPTGDIEIAPTEITVLGRCRYNELPFEINHSREADESQRLKYRYLDLRNPEVKANIILRCNVVSALRTAMTEHGFLEITTPILTASSPERRACSRWRRSPSAPGCSRPCVLPGLRPDAPRPGPIAVFPPPGCRASRRSRASAPARA